MRNWGKFCWLDFEENLFTENFAARSYCEDGCLGRIDDGAEVLDAEHAEIRDSANG